MNKKMEGQAAVETLFASVFLTLVFFGAIGITRMVTAWLRANEAAQAGLRCALVTTGSTVEGAETGDPEKRARLAVLWAMGASFPARVELWDKSVLEEAGKDHSSGPEKNGALIRMFSVHIYPLGGAEFKAHCRMIKPPDWRYYEKAYPGAYYFDK
jgi:hypothetical protein